MSEETKTDGRSLEDLRADEIKELIKYQGQAISQILVLLDSLKTKSESSEASELTDLRLELEKIKTAIFERPEKKDSKLSTFGRSIRRRSR